MKKGKIMYDTGNWIKLNRGIWDNFIWDFDKPKYALAWIDMLLLANYTDKKVMFDGKVEVVKRGCFLTSMVKLSNRWNMDRSTVKRFLDILQDDGMITYTCNNRRTAITIQNYSVYQSFIDNDTTTDTTDDSASDTPSDTSTDTPSDTSTVTATDSAQHKNVKKVKKERSLKENKKDKKIYSDVPELNEALNSFVEFRKKIKSPMTEHAVDLMIKKLNELTDSIPEQIDILNQSIVNGWKGVFPLKEKKAYNNGNQKQSGTAQQCDDFYYMAANWAAEGE